MSGTILGVADGTGPLLLHETPIGPLTTSGLTTSGLTTSGLTTSGLTTTTTTATKLSAASVASKLSLSLGVIGGVLLTGAIVGAVGLVSYAVTKAAMES